MNSHPKTTEIRLSLILALAACVHPYVNAQSRLERPEDPNTNAVGVLRIRTEPENRDLGNGGRLISSMHFELYPLPDSHETNRILTLSAKDSALFDRLFELVDENVRIEGQLVERSRLNDKREPERWLYHLVITNASLYGQARPMANLNQEEANRLARKLAKVRMALNDGDLKRAALPKLVSGRWTWSCRGGRGKGDFEVTVTFDLDGRSSDVRSQYFTSEVYLAP